MNHLEAEIAEDEGYREHLYRCTAGKLTIGYGTNISAGLPRDEALMLMRLRLVKLERELNRRLPWFATASPARRRALLNMAYQMGADGLMGFRKMLAAAAAGNWDAAADHALDSKWAKIDTPARAQRVAARLRQG